MSLIDKAIKEFLTLEAYAESMRVQAYKARVALERVHAPAPKGGKKVLSNTKKAQLVTTLRKTLLKPRQ